MGRNCLNAVYNHVEKETVAAILDLEDIKFAPSCVDNTNSKVRYLGRVAAIVVDPNPVGSASFLRSQSRISIHFKYHK
jgi:hypothetical protein